MSSKKDLLKKLVESASHTPDGGYVPTNGWNYGLDGFHFDTEYGDGAVDQARLPEAKGLSALPDSVMSENDASEKEAEFYVESDHTTIDPGGMYFLNDDEGVTAEEWDKQATAYVEELNNLDWLDPTLQQDPERLPANTTEDTDSEMLEMFWQDVRPQGLHRVPAERKEEYKKQITETQYSGLPEGEAKKQAVQKALRQISYGSPMKQILKNMKYSMAHDEAMQTILTYKNDIGLAGRVFIREAAFPGLFSPSKKWHKFIKNKFAHVPYILVDDLEDRVLPENWLGKKVVSRIPWKEAEQKLAHRFAAQGITLRGGTPQERIRKAFSIVPMEKVRKTFFPEISIKEATQEEADNALREASKRDQTVISKKPVEQVLNERVHNAIQKMASQSKLTPKQASDLIDQLQGGDVSRKQIIQRTLALVKKSETRSANYQGAQFSEFIPETDYGKSKVQQAELFVQERNQSYRSLKKLVVAGSITEVQAEKIWAHTQNPKEVERIASYVIAKNQSISQTTPQSDISNRSYEGTTFRQKDNFKRQKTSKLNAKSHLLKKAKDGLSRLVRQGLLSQNHSDELLSSNRTPMDMLKAASGIIAENNRRASVIESTTQTQQYEGTHFSEHVPQTRQRNANSNEVRKLLRWARQQFSEGMLGNDFDAFLGARFSKKIISAASDALQAIRKEHEGLSGQVYVDAQAYASTNGTKGCDKGALKHRGNTIPSVLKMARCGGCAFANCLSDGTRVCQKYNKTLVASAPVENPAKWQKEAIRLANASDAEVTASLFGATYDAAEFNLDNHEMGALTLDETPDNEHLANVVFGGLLLDDE